jgi:cytosine/adenosine deaminase-related metal-dependent hydrolase
MKRQMQSGWIVNARIVTQDARRRVLRGHLHVEAGRISEIRPASRGRPRGRVLYDAAGLTLLPGFVQAHVHLCQTLFRNQADDLELLDWLSKRIWVMEAAHTPRTLRASARLGIHELLASGTTCILDMGTVRHTEAIFEAVRDTGIRASVGKCLMDRPGTTPPALREPTGRALAEAAVLFAKWNGRESDRIRVSYAPRFVISCTERLLKEVARLARAQGALVHTHASENRKEIELVRRLTGAENVEYLDRIGLTGPSLVLAHCVWLGEKERRILARTGTHVAHCPGSNLKLASGVAPIPNLLRRGVNVALGADGAPCNNSLDAFHEMRLAALVHKPAAGPRAMRAREVLDLATLGGARALGWLDDIGSIEVGKKADLVALDLGTPLNLVPESAGGDLDALASAIVYSSSPGQVRATWVDGRILYRDGRVVTIPEKPLLAEIRAAQRQIARRVRLITGSGQK